MDKPEYTFTNQQELIVGSKAYYRFRKWLWKEKQFHTSHRITSLKSHLLSQYLAEFLGEYVKIESDLNIFDVWESPNGNLFLKINDEYSVPLGHKSSVGQVLQGMENDHCFIKRNNITAVKKVGQVIMNFELLNR